VALLAQAFNPADRRSPNVERGNSRGQSTPFMTKAQEIAKLEEFIKSIPRDSYLRPWLEDVLPQVRADILNDFCVSPSVTETRQRAEVILAEARQQAAEIVAQAQKNAEGVMTLARQRYQQSIGSARSALHQAERALDV